MDPVTEAETTYDGAICESITIDRNTLLGAWKDDPESTEKESLCFSISPYHPDCPDGEFCPPYEAFDPEDVSYTGGSGSGGGGGGGGGGGASPSAPAPPSNPTPSTPLPTPTPEPPNIDIELPPTTFV